MPHIDSDEDDGADFPPEVLDNPNIDWIPSLNHDEVLDDVFKDRVFADTAHGTPKVWTKFGEMEEYDRMSVMEQVDLPPSSPTESSPDYGPSQEDLFEGLDDEMLPALEPDILMEGNHGPAVTEVDVPAVPIEEQGITVTEAGASEVSINDAVRVELPESLLLVPISCYEPFEPGVPIVEEYEAVVQLFEAATQAGQDIDDFIELELDDFAIYCDRTKYGQEMCSLHHLDTKMGFSNSNSYFNGRLSVGGTAFFVRRVPVFALQIGGYGALSKHTVRDKIWIRSHINCEREIYYRLNKPAKEYRRFFIPFTWVADLAKHFVEYIKVMGESKRDVNIFHFRSTFSSWLQKTHKKDPIFVCWRDQHPSDDFRTSVVANLAFLHKEAVGVLGRAKTYKHTLWSEIWEFRRYETFPKDKQQIDSKTPKRSRSQIESITNEANKAKDDSSTIVTQYIYDCFSHLPFGDRLEAMRLSEKTQLLQSELIQERHLELPAPVHRNAKNMSTAGRQQIQDIQPGDTISTPRDVEESGTKWRRDVPHGFHDVDRWLALVQRVHIDKRGRRSYDVIWYYRAVDTLCALMKYPWNNELFLSDHCSCHDIAKIRDDEVLGVHTVEFGGTSATDAEFFCRQTYICSERKWITLAKDHLHCTHTRKSVQVPKHRPGETRLIIVDKASGRSEPCEFITFYEEEGTGIYRFRKLLRRHQVDPLASKARPNELVYSENLIEVKERRILEPCHVRFFKAGEKIPAPYDRDGVGGFFYITHEEVLNEETAGKSYVTLKVFPASLQQGYDPLQPIQRLRGLDLFCGGGNFGRGLEDGGGIEMKWANDFNEKAIHTYMANTSGPGDVSPFLGSIDELQRMAINGEFADNVPPVGDVDFISGGSPCPGFSLLTNDKTTKAQRKNQSLVAAFGSFIDLYRPRYGLLENVPGIVQSKSNRDQDVFSQLICAIVGLGYQAHVFFLDASSCGSPQRRSRVFLAFAAPGHRLPRRPDPTHAHPERTRKRGLGSLPTGDSMVERIEPLATPFNFVSARAATADLPAIHDSKPDICVPYPDHRVSLGLTTLLRNKINLIPNRPWGMNFAQAWYGLDRKKAGSGILTPADRLVFPVDSNTSLGRTKPGSNAYGRQRPDLLIETIVTSQSPSDAKNGKTLHWRENRVLTIMEARRAQGFRDHEVLLGSPSDQFKIVGNSVAREVAVSLGAVFREAWAQSLADEHHLQGDTTATGITTTTACPCEVPARMGIEVSSSVHVGKPESREISNGANTPRMRKSRSLSITTESRATKSSKSNRDDTPSRATSTASSRSRPSRLRLSVKNE
ncbi:dna (cytosine-5-)-methyltransferase [Fusarium heterosporum]|uniref:DNA (cytosine-5-)-methyltransferase n=1 Tax=Fusarium heterosporum TaxID=42747 RepID=A0A8H5TP64_FUSHE|nr:dna (cytosine-5-)-methyltransferase [Fusarium heterosporum]